MHKTKEIDMLNPSFFKNPKIVIDLYDFDIARMIDKLDDNSRLEICNILPDDKLSRIIPKCRCRIHLLELLGDRRSKVLNVMDIFYLKKIILKDNRNYNYLNKDLKEKLDDVINDGNQLLSFYITDRFLKCNIHDKKEDILRNIKVRRNNIYVVDDDNMYLGFIKISDLLNLKDNDLSKILKTHYPFFRSNDYVSKFLIINDKYHLEGYPVIDDSGKLLGVIDRRGIMDLINEELYDDYDKLAGLTHRLKYSDNDQKLLQKRLPWLIVAFIINFLLAMWLQMFRDRVIVSPFLVLYQVMILNIGQAVAFNTLGATNRVLEHKSLDPDSLVRFTFKEFRKGIIIAFVLSIITFIVLYFYFSITKKPIISDIFYISDAIRFSLTISVVMIIVILESTIIGFSAPIIINRLKLDFSLSSMIFVSVISDLFSIFIFYAGVYIGCGI